MPQCNLNSCVRDGTFRCSSCKQSHYCSTAHQKEDWTQHQDECPVICASNVSIPFRTTSTKFLLITGLLFDIEDCFFLKNFLDPKACFGGRPNYEAISFPKRMSKFLQKISSGEFNTIVIFQLCQGGKDELFFESKMKDFIQTWVQRGGTLILNGSKNEMWGPWFGLGWHYKGNFFGTNEYNVKASMLDGVDASHGVYYPKPGATAISVLGNMPGFGGTPIESEKCPLAIAPYGRGRVAFIGDVNAEASTMKWIYTIGVLPSTGDYRWYSCRDFLMALYGSKFLILASSSKSPDTESKSLGRRLFQNKMLVQNICKFL
jgi:hypothetical protein